MNTYKGFDRFLNNKALNSKCLCVDNHIFE